VRLGTDQNFVLTGVPQHKVDALLDEELLQKYSPFPGPFERGVVACTGNEFCRFAVVETKERAVTWARWLDTQLRSEPAGERAAVSATSKAEDAGVIRMHFSGCSASCAQPQIADIGFRGDVAHVGERIVEGVDIGMGGSLGPDAAFIDWIENARPVDDVPDALLRSVRRYQSERRDGEPFYNWARRTPNEELAATLAGLDTDRSPVGRP
jgi:ferredoxin-nitrite reductase